MIVDNLKIVPDRLSPPGGVVTLTYDIGSAYRACDRVLIDGQEIASSDCFPVTGTVKFPQKRVRNATVVWRDVDFVLLVVKVQETAPDGTAIGSEMELSGPIRMNQA